MATWTSNLTLSAGNPLTGSKTLSDTNAQRIMTAFRKKYGMSAASTNQQVWNSINDEIWEWIKQTTMNVEIQQQQAALSVDPVE